MVEDKYKRSTDNFNKCLTDANRMFNEGKISASGYESMINRCSLNRTIGKSVDYVSNIFKNVTETFGNKEDRKLPLTVQIANAVNRNVAQPNAKVAKNIANTAKNTVTSAFNKILIASVLFGLFYVVLKTYVAKAAT